MLPELPADVRLTTVGVVLFSSASIRSLVLCGRLATERRSVRRAGDRDQRRKNARTVLSDDRNHQGDDMGATFP
jgi:hypothetical protein